MHAGLAAQSDVVLPLGIVDRGAGLVRGACGAREPLVGARGEITPGEKFRRRDLQIDLGQIADRSYGLPVLLWPLLPKYDFPELIDAV